MKRILMLGSFIGGLACAGMLHDNQAFGQKPDNRSQVERATEERANGERATAVPNASSNTKPEANPQPARLPKNEILEQQQTIQDIMELRQRFGSVVGDQDQQFSQLVQHLVEDEGTNKLAAESPAAEVPVLGQAISPDATPPVVAQQNTPLGRVPSQTPADESGLNRIPEQQLPPFHPSFHSQPATDVLQSNRSQPSNSYPLGPSSNLVHAGAPPRYPNRPKSKDFGQIQRIRKVARQLDESACDLEDLGEYEAADQIRARAQSLRESCRH